MQRKRSAAIVVSLLMLCLVLGGCTAANASADGSASSMLSGEGEAPGQSAGYHILRVGDQAPDFSVDTMDGETFTLSEANGRVVVIYFWASWCGPCLAELPEIQQLYDSRTRDELEIIAVNSGEKLSRVEWFLEKNSYSFLFAADEEFDIGDKYPSSGVPYTVIVGPDGMVADILYRSNDAEEERIREAVDLVLKGKSA